MRQIGRRTVHVAMLLAATTGFLISSKVAFGQSPESVKTAHDAMKSWVGNSENGTAWQTFLRSQELDAELAKGSSANREVLQSILTIYKSSTTGLSYPGFSSVRDALQNWISSLPPSGPNELAKLATDAKVTFTPIPGNLMQTRRDELWVAAANLEQYLATGTKESHDGWNSFLQIKDLNTQLALPTPDVSVLQSVLSKFQANENGLELEKFDRVKKSLRAYMDVVTVGTTEKAQEVYGPTLDDLSKRLEAFAKNPNADDALVIGRSLGWLRRAGQSPALISSVQQQYWKPNIFVSASQRLVGAGIEEPVSDTQPVNENILGTEICGTAHTNGVVSMRFVPNNDLAAFDIKMSGLTHSDTIGFNRGVTIYSRGQTQVETAKRVLFGEYGFTSQPACASCSTCTTIDDICAKLRIIERIAWKKAGKSKGEAEQISSERAEQKVAARVDAQAGEMLAKNNAKFMEKFRNPLLRRGEFPRLAKFSTTADRLNIKLMQVNETQLAAPTDPPASPAEHDLVVRMHESLVSNTSEAFLGGVTITDERLEKLVKDATGEVPEELKIGPEKDPWSITFSPDQPISVTLNGNELTLAVRSRKLTRGEQEIKNNIKISATYNFEKTPTGSKLTRKGDVEVEFVNHKGGLSIQQVAFKTFMKRKFEAMMKPEFQSDGIKLPGRWEHAGKLRLQHMQTEKGWAVVTWQLTPSYSVSTVATSPVVREVNDVLELAGAP